MTASIKEIMTTSPVIPVMVINQIELAVPLAQALVNGGLKVLEITLRTPAALEAIRRIKAEVPGAIVGAGTIKYPDANPSFGGRRRIHCQPRRHRKFIGGGAGFRNTDTPRRRYA